MGGGIFLLRAGEVGSVMPRRSCALRVVSTGAFCSALDSRSTAAVLVVDDVVLSLVDDALLARSVTSFASPFATTSRLSVGLATLEQGLLLVL